MRCLTFPYMAKGLFIKNSLKQLAIVILRQWQGLTIPRQTNCQATCFEISFVRVDSSRVTVASQTRVNGLIYVMMLSVI